ncbi:MAG: DUF87 domain-containing protein, partial [Pseudomonadota bacterium]
LLGKHFAILGTTGSGKSCTVALVMHAILSRYSNGHVVLLDPHNEYSQAFGKAAEVIGPDTLELPYWLFNFEEISEILVSRTSRTREEERSILVQLIQDAKKSYLGDVKEADFVTADTPVPYRLGELTRFLDEAMGKLENAEKSAPYKNIRTRLEQLQADRRFDFLFSGLSVSDNMADILSRIFRIPVNGKPITIMDLSAVPSEILNVVVSVLCRMTFDFAIWSERSMPILLVCEEAHRYAPRDTTAGFEPTKRAISKISKEGRKYGVSLCIVTQRPSELETSILSECNTIFALRMTNVRDQDFVRAAMSESSLGMMESLSSLRTGEAICVGEGVTLPVRMCFDTLPETHRPQSGTASFSTAWENDNTDPNFIPEVISRWRIQRR